MALRPTFGAKTAVVTSTLPEENKWTESNINEVRSVLLGHADDIELNASNIQASAEGIRPFVTLADADAFYTANPPVSDVLFRVTDDGANTGDYTRFSATNTNSARRDIGVSDEQLQNIVDIVLQPKLFPSIANGFLETDGTVTLSANWRVTDFIPIFEGQNISYQGITQFNAQAVVGYDENQDFVQVIEGELSSLGAPTSVAIPTGIKFVRCSGRLTGGDVFIINAPSPTYPSRSDIFTINKKWRAVGHSIWEQDGNTYPSSLVTARGVQTIIRSMFTFDDYTNLGYSGKSLAGLTAGDTSSILNFTGSWLQGEIWTLDTITNDFRRNIPIGVLSDYTNNTGITTYYGALRVFNDVIVGLGGVEYVIASNALRRDNSGYTSTSVNTAGHTLTDYENALLVICERNDWWFIDQFRGDIRDENLSTTTYDGLHPNDFGYKLMATKWVELFTRINQFLI